jgi:hypothetical protein
LISAINAAPSTASRASNIRQIATAQARTINAARRKKKATTLPMTQLRRKSMVFGLLA